MILFYGYDHPATELAYGQSHYVQHVITTSYKVSSLTEVTWTVEEPVALIEVPEEKVHESVVSHRTKVLEVYFNFDSSKLKPQEKTKLSSLEPGSYFLVGHACWIGSDSYNKKLSLGRAYSVSEYLKSLNYTVSGIDYRGEEDCDLYRGYPVKKAKPLLEPCRKVEVYRDGD